jgi:hypothetical protein
MHVRWSFPRVERSHDRSVGNIKSGRTPFQRSYARQLPLVERALEVELTDHLGGGPSSAAFRGALRRAEELTEDVEAAIEASAAA